MSIAPVESFPPQRNAEPENPNAASGYTQARSASGAVAESAAQPVSGTLSKQESTVAQSVSSTYEMPQDVVEVHQDPEIKDQIIIEYLDTAKNVVLQVPSAEELSVERAIAQEFVQAAKLRPNPVSRAAGNEGEETHGD